ncbi:GNAT family N-acetyltransferase [Xanthomonas campestris]|uniref:GNAT family N-acetyltransferase n=1 Tax=Xanthomonas campestris TaxID=339 RepID=UPI0039C00DF5
MEGGAPPRFVAVCCAQIVGFCFGDRHSGEVIALAVTPSFGQLGVGRGLLGLLVPQLSGGGHSRLFTGCTADPALRSQGFYRHLGWMPTGRVNPQAGGRYSPQAFVEWP